MVELQVQRHLGRRDQGLARLCFAKRDDTLQRALDRLARL
jgi:hypothetical protein